MAKKGASNSCVAKLFLLCGPLNAVAAFHIWTFSDLMQLPYSLSNPHIVDSWRYNVLMRLGNTASYDIFRGPYLSLPALASILRQKAGNFFPSHSYELVDVSLLHGKNHQDIFSIERKTIALDPFGGRLIHWPSHGIQLDYFQSVCERFGLECPSTMQPDHMSHPARLQLARHHHQWDPDQLDARVQALHALLMNSSTGPDGRHRVIIFHGMGGCDSTGALHAAYALRYRNRSLTEAMAENELIARRHIQYKHQVAAQWYCEYLVSRGLYSHGYDCDNCYPYRCLDDGDPWDSESMYMFLAVVAAAITLLLVCWRCVFPNIFMHSTGVKQGWHLSASRRPLLFLGGPCATPEPSSPLSTPPPMIGIWRRRRGPEDEYALLSA
jgi:hypothetical protein